MVELKTQQILHLESNVAKVVDPLGGSCFIESLTNEMERRFWKRIREIEAMGDPDKIKDVLSAALEKAKDEEQNLMGATMEAFEAGATMGEIGGAVRLAYNCPYDPDGLIESPI